MPTIAVFEESARLEALRTELEALARGHDNARKLDVIGGIRIVIYYNDHEPPHFHAVFQAGHRIKVEIARLRVIGGACPAAMERRVIEWASRWQPELALCWARVRSGQPPGRIA